MTEPQKSETWADRLAAAEARSTALEGALTGLVEAIDRGLFGQFHPMAAVESEPRSWRLLMSRLDDLLTAAREVMAANEEDDPPPLDEWDPAFLRLRAALAAFDPASVLDLSAPETVERLADAWHRYLVATAPGAFTAEQLLDDAGGILAALRDRP